MPHKYQSDHLNPGLPCSRASDRAGHTIYFVLVKKEAKACTYVLSHFISGDVHFFTNEWRYLWIHSTNFQFIFQTYGFWWFLRSGQRLNSRKKNV